MTATEVGWISGTGLILYGAGQIVSGHLADRVGGRRLVALGAVTSCVLNWLASLGGGFWSLVIPWALNGYAQSMGFAPASRLIAAWWAPRERGWAFGVFNFAAGFSSVLTFGAAALVLAWLSWRWVLRLPVLLLLVGAAVVWLLARDRPEELGLHPQADAEATRELSLRPTGKANDDTVSLGVRLRAAFGNRAFLLASLGFGFANWARLGLLVWVPSHLLGPAGGASPGPPGSRWPCRWGWLSGPSPVATPSTGSSAATIRGSSSCPSFSRPGRRWVFWLVPPDARSLGLLFAAGFLVFGPFPSFTVLGAELLGPRAVGVGVGFMNAVGYGTAALGDVVMGVVIDATGWTGAVFAVAAVACFSEPSRLRAGRRGRPGRPVSPPL